MASKYLVLSFSNNLILLYSSVSLVMLHSSPIKNPYPQYSLSIKTSALDEIASATELPLIGLPPNFIKYFELYRDIRLSLMF